MRLALRRTAVTVSLALALPLLPAAPGAQAADPVEVAELEVAGLRAEVDRTAQLLTAGTRRLERGQAELGEVRRKLSRAQREAAEAAGRSAQARDRLRVVVAAAYKSPLPDAFVLALSSGPDRFRDAMVAQADLQRVRGTQQDLLRAATGERVRAEGSERTVEQLTDETAIRERELAAQVSALRSVAQQSADRLSQAAARLATARDARLKARAARARAAAAADCTAGPGRAINGFLDAASLCPLDGAPGQALRADAAAAFNQLTAAARAARGTALCVTDSYRSYPGQVSVYRRMPSLAAVPGTSRHGLGIALDLGCGVERFGSEAYRWMTANGPRFGWVHPEWAEPDGSMPEPWHWEFVR